MINNRVGFALSFGLLGLATAFAGELHIYEHNGSVIDWIIVGDTIKATYNTPRPGLEAIGVRPGATVFEGFYEGNRIVGKAYAFKSGCDPVPYQVIGLEQGGQIVLRGPAPARSREGCAVVKYSLQSPHATLTFTYSATHH